MCIMDTTTTETPEEDLVSKIDTRRSNKPLMEKKRRQRINRCLNDLKTLVLEALKKDPSRYSKLEKADILEMTVRHVQSLHRYEAAGGRMVGSGRLMGGGRSVGSEDKAKYRAGFTQCAIEVTKYLGSMSGVPQDLHKKVISHLNNVTSAVTGVPGAAHPLEVPSGGASVVVGRGVVTVAPPTTAHTSSAAPLITTAADFSSTGGLGLSDRPGCGSLRSPPPLMAPGSSAVPTSSSPVRVSAGVTLVPARLASGQMALVLPPGITLPLDANQTSPSTLRDPVNRDINNLPSSNNIPSIPGSPVKVSPEIDAGSGEHPASSTYTSLKDPRNVSSSSTDNSLFPISLQSPKSFTFSLTKSVSHSFDVESSTSSSHLSSGKAHPVTAGNTTQTQRFTSPDLLALAPPLRLSSSMDDTSCTPTTSATTRVLTRPSQGVDFNESTSGMASQVAVNESECSALATLSNMNKEVIGALSNFSTSSLPTLVRPTPTLPQRVQATTSAETSEMQHTAQPLSTSATRLPEAAPTPPTPAASHEPLNLVTHDHSRDAACGRRSYKAASSSVWRRAAPYRLPHPSRRAQPWRPW